MRRAAKVDANQTEIVNALRGAGASVKPVHTVKGFVDIVVGYRGHNYLLEIKDGNKTPSQRKLTAEEQKFHDGWKGTVATVISVEDALEVLKHG